MPPKRALPLSRPPQQQQNTKRMLMINHDAPENDINDLIALFKTAEGKSPH
jgi:hypothetical protein